jgi:hypothetical protein
MFAQYVSPSQLQLILKLDMIFPTRADIENHLKDIASPKQPDQQDLFVDAPSDHLDKIKNA